MGAGAQTCNLGLGEFSPLHLSECTQVGLKSCRRYFLGIGTVPACVFVFDSIVNVAAAPKEENMRCLMKAFCNLLLLATFALLCGCSNPSTPAGHEGYVKENPRIWGKGGFRGSLKGPANYGVSLWRNEVENVDFRPQTYTETFNILAKDELNISFNRK